MFCMATLAAGSWQHQYSEQFFFSTSPLVYLLEALKSLQHFKHEVLFILRDKLTVCLGVKIKNICCCNTLVWLKVKSRFSFISIGRSALCSRVVSVYFWLFICADRATLNKYRQFGVRIRHYFKCILKRFTFTLRRPWDVQCNTFLALYSSEWDIVFYQCFQLRL